jgi:hypothetical protein
VVAHAFNPSTWEGRGRWISELETSLVYRVSSRTARDIQRNPVSKIKKKKKKTKKHKTIKQGMVAHTYNPNIQEAEPGRMLAQVQPGPGRQSKQLQVRSCVAMDRICGSQHFVV